MLLFAAAQSWACSCFSTTTPCSQVGGSTVIFVARVITDSGEGFGTGPAHVAIEEGLQNVPSGLREADINTAAGTSCYFRLKVGERYVIITKGPSYSVAACSSSFQIRGKEHILQALRDQINGGSPVLLGTVLKSTGAYSHGGGIEGVSVAAEAGEGSSPDCHGRIWPYCDPPYSILGDTKSKSRKPVTSPIRLTISAGRGGWS